MVNGWSVTSLTKQYIGVHKLFWQLMWSLREHSFRTWEVVENKKFWKSGKNSIEKNIVAIFFSLYRSIEHDNSHKTLLYGSKMWFDKYCATTIWSFLWDPKKSWTKLFKKRLSSRWQKILAYSFSYYPVWQTSGDKL